ncbi:MAG: 2-oxoacid:acceptor oxidoreductase subunit alpha [Candidatus Riflebacteria bacterium]|nr:2-oxoacid:acceptor oxidoreductase subunit alpha [Candidatus Riflebacteria bacterium]
MVREDVIPNHLAIVLAGEAGSGVQSIETIVTRAFRRDGFHVFAGKEYMSRIRGGSNSTLIRVGTEPVRAWSDHVHLCIPLDEQAFAHVKKRLSPDSLVLGEQTVVGTGKSVVDLPLTAMASEVGGALYANTIAAGVIWGLFVRDPAILESVLQAYFADKPGDVIERNQRAARMGIAHGQNLRISGKVPFAFPERPPKLLPLFMTGAEAVALGAIAGGCNFVSSYPMSPSTGVLTFLAQHARELGIAVEQAEDEISAANMVLGAWYAGARGLATTSGGGFSLMTEAISLAGMIESPMVIHLAQRPGPATGLPTRTEQGDLELALYAGHGEFPRALFAPGNIEQAFDLTRRGFDLADSFQVPVFILTDQYLMDSGYDVENFNLEQELYRPAIIQAKTDYRRYCLSSPDGLSPRGIPGWGEGLVCVDSDEHDECAHITEDAEVRMSMVEKRRKKEKGLVSQVVPPDWYGSPEAEVVAICWGSTLEPLLEAVLGLALPGLAVLHFSQVFPLPPQGKFLPKKAQRLILVEGNASGQFGRLLKGEWEITWHARLLKYDGLPFSVEGLRDSLQKILRRKEQS